MKLDIGPADRYAEALDPFDPRTWDLEPAPDAPMQLCLSNRWDIHVTLDYQDWLWAREYLWCHDYGSGEMVEVAEDVWCIARPECIYARRSVPIPGRKTPSGRPAYGSEFLHKCILKLKTGRNPRNMVGDHKDGDTLNCRRYNLRWATKSQNAINVPGSKVRMRFQNISYQRAG